MHNSFLITGPNEFFSNAVRNFFKSPNNYPAGFRIIIEHVYVEETKLFTGLDHYNVGFVSNGNWLLGGFDGGNDFCLYLSKEQIKYLQFYADMHGSSDARSVMEETNRLLMLESDGLLSLYKACPLPIQNQFETGTQRYFDFKFEFEDEREDMWLETFSTPFERLHAEYTSRRDRLASGKASADEFIFSKYWIRV